MAVQDRVRVDGTSSGDSGCVVLLAGSKCCHCGGTKGPHQSNDHCGADFSFWRNNSRYGLHRIISMSVVETRLLLLRGMKGTSFSSYITLATATVCADNGRPEESA